MYRWEMNMRSALTLVVAFACVWLPSCDKPDDDEGSTRTGTPKSQIAADIRKSADWIAEALGSSGYKADFTLESLKEIDRFFDEHSRNGQPVPGGLLSQDLGQRIFAIGSYVGEVIRRGYGGEWKGDDDDPKVEMNVELRLPDGTVCWPIQRVMKRYKNGSEDGIHVYAYALTEGLRKK